MSLMSFRIGEVINIIYLVYSAVRWLIQIFYQITLAQGSPELALKFADATTLLITITTVWIIMEFTTSLKRIFRIVVILGWILLIVSIFLSV